MKRLGLIIIAGLIVLVLVVNLNHRNEATAAITWTDEYRPGMGMDASYLTDALKDLNPGAFKSSSETILAANPAATTPAVVKVADNNPKEALKTKSTQDNSSKKGTDKPLVLASAAGPPSDSTSVRTPTPSRGATGSNSGVLTTARKYMGVPYVYGGVTPSGFDCSGFTQYVFDKSGVNLPRVAADQAQVGVKVSRSDLAPGDLVFFSTEGSRSINHVGIYVGDNQFIHASRTKGITVTSLDNSYYKDILTTSRRVVR